MKAEKAMDLLQISRKTLHFYAKDAYKILNRGVKRKTVLYARESTQKHKNELQNQTDQMKHLCYKNSHTINAIYSDIASGISFEKRIGIFDMPYEIMNSKVEKFVFTYKDRFSRFYFELFSNPD